MAARPDAVPDIAVGAPYFRRKGVERCAMNGAGAPFAFLKIEIESRSRPT